VKPSWGLTLLRFVVGFLAVSILVLGFLGFGLPLMAVGYLCFGWIGYLFGTLPNVTIDWPNVAWGLSVLLIFSVGLHYFCRWFYAAWNADGDQEISEPGWPKRWTAAMVGIIVTMFVSGIALVGVTHQIAWLATSEERLIGSSWNASKRAVSRNNLKQQSLSTMNYHDSAKKFPPAVTFSPEGLPLHGWPVSILPHLDYAALDRAIDKDVPWDHPKNREPLSVRLPVFLSRGFEKSAEATPDGYAAIHYAANWQVLYPGSEVSFEDISDGAANTLLFGEVAATFQPWGSTDNLRDPTLGLNKSPVGFGSPWKGVTHFSFADGRVQSISNDIDPSVLRALATPDGGEEIGDY
jgi:hypothetical protein